MSQLQTISHTISISLKPLKTNDHNKINRSITKIFCDVRTHVSRETKPRNPYRSKGSDATISLTTSDHFHWTLYTKRCVLWWWWWWWCWWSAHARDVDGRLINPYTFPGVSSLFLRVCSMVIFDFMFKRHYIVVLMIYWILKIGELRNCIFHAKSKKKCAVPLYWCH